MPQGDFKAVFSRFMLITGLLAIVFAVNATVLSLPIGTAIELAGIAFVVSCIGGSIEHVRLRQTGDSSIWSTLFVIADAVVGVALLAHPTVAGDVLPWLVALCIIAHGALSVVAAMAMRKLGLSIWGWTLASGIVFIMCAVILFVLPVFLPSLLPIVMAVRGVTLIVFDSVVTKRRNERASEAAGKKKKKKKSR